MRWTFRLLFVCVLDVMLAVGCLDPFLESESCDGVVCPDDGNECTSEFCRCDGWWCTAECVSAPVVNGTDCSFDGVAGVCVSGVCGENLCEGVACEDDDACTHDECDYVDGTCHFPTVECWDDNMCTEEEAKCDPVDGCIFTAVEDGSFCYPDLSFPIPGVCKAGSCGALPTQACTNAEDLESVCDPRFEDEVQACATLRFEPGTAPCLVESTGISVDCASCYGAVVHCVFENCFGVCVAGTDPEECDACKAGHGCDTPFADCTGDLESACPSGDSPDL